MSDRLIYLSPNSAQLARCHEFKFDSFRSCPFVKEFFLSGVVVTPHSQAFAVWFKRLADVAADLDYIYFQDSWHGEYPLACEKGIASIYPPVISVPCPGAVADLFWEARTSYATDALYAALCCVRGVLEQAVTDVGSKIKVIPEPDGSRKYSRDNPVLKRIAAVTSELSDQRERLNELWNSASESIHRGTRLSHDETRGMIGDIADGVAELYASFSRSYGKAITGEIPDEVH